jgi:hypothetical protein
MARGKIPKNFREPEAVLNAIKWMTPHVSAVLVSSNNLRFRSSQTEAGKKVQMTHRMRQILWPSVGLSATVALEGDTNPICENKYAYCLRRGS